MHTIPRSEFPRPDFERENWLPLNGDWQFSIDSPTFDRVIRVPFACETRLSGIEERGFHDRVYYRRTVELPERMREHNLLLHFGAVDYSCRVFVDGRLAVAHMGGQTPFSADITPLLRSKERFVIEVEVEDDPFDLEMPRGKQYWKEKPGGIFYDRTTGIWQSVWLEAVEPLYLKNCIITPLFDRRAVRFDYTLSEGTGCTLETVITLDRREVVRLSHNAFGQTGSFAIPLDSPDTLKQCDFFEELCWTPERPRLFDVLFTVKREGETLDRVRSYFGMRKVSVEDGIFLLNNRPYYQKLVLDQGYWPDSLLTAPDDEAFIRDIQLIKQMGFNGVRKHQKVEDPRFLYHADRMGLLVWGEIGSAYVYSPNAACRLYREWQEAVLRDINHPCIVAWTPLNESWGVPAIHTDPAQQAHCQALYHLTRSLDPTRPVICNDGWEHTGGDLLTLHDYTADAELLAARYRDMEQILKLHPGKHSLYARGFSYRGEPVLVSEYGGIKYAAGPAADNAWGYCEAADAKAFEDKYRALTSALLNAPDVQGYCYTQLTDVGTETNGLLTQTREAKIPLETIRRINRG